MRRVDEGEAKIFRAIGLVVAATTRPIARKILASPSSTRRTGNWSGAPAPLGGNAPRRAGGK